MCQGPITLNQLASTGSLRELPVLTDALGTFLKDVKPSGRLLTMDKKAIFESRRDGYLQLMGSKKLIKALKRLELSVIWFILSLTEGVSQERILTVASSLLESVLFDSLQRNHTDMTRGKYKQRPHAKRMTVAYLSLLLKTADAMEIAEGSTARTDNVVAWQAKCAEEGYDINNFIASVEIVDKNGNVDRVYFPIPDFVNSYWMYPGQLYTNHYSIYTLLSYTIYIHYLHVCLQYTVFIHICL